MPICTKNRTRRHRLATTGRMKLAEHLRHLSLGFFGKRDPGDVTNLLLSDYAQVEHTISRNVPQLISAVMLPVLALLGLAFLDWKMALAMFVALPFGALLLWLTDTLPREVTLSKTDLASWWQAKQIVDANLLSPPSLAELSRQFCLNQYKLKKGFKQLFGLPVHAYVIDQRLEQSRRLLEEGSVNVTYAASMAGFNNLRQFAEKFRKKYGVNPSAYLKSRGFRPLNHELYFVIG